MRMAFYTEILALAISSATQNTIWTQRRRMLVVVSTAYCQYDLVSPLSRMLKLDYRNKENPRFRVLVSDLDQGCQIEPGHLSPNDPHLVGDSPDASSKGLAGRQRRTVGSYLTQRYAQYLLSTQGTPMFAAAAIAEPKWEYPRGHSEVLQ